MSAFRHNWTTSEAVGLMTGPLDELLSHAKEVHKAHSAQDVQKCVLLSVKTGACPEDCGYCSQSARYQTGLEREALMDVDKVLEAAKNAKAGGASRFCMGAAWRDVPSGNQFEKVLQMIRGVSGEGLEVCCTMGMATEDQLTQMKDAGLTAYNHNLDTSREHYDKVISTRTYDERIETLKAVRKSGVQICCGGIIGMGETVEDRANLLVELANLNPHPESVPINLLVPIKGTPLEDQDAVPFESFLRTIAVARIMMPASRVRLSAGRNSLSEDQQRQCFDAGANSIFAGEKLLTTPNVEWGKDEQMFRKMPKEQQYDQTGA